MVKFNSSNGRNAGFSLVEMMVVLAVAGFLSVMILFQLRNFDDGQKVSSVAKKFIVDNNSAKTQAYNGADGKAVKVISIKAGDSEYKLGGKTISTGSVKVKSINTGTGLLSICYAHPELDAFSVAIPCGNCTSGSSFACNGSSPYGSNINVTFTNGKVDKSVIISGSGMRVNQVYAQN